jgi:hypothetical protein
MSAVTGMVNLGIWFITSGLGRFIVETFIPHKPAELMDDVLIPALTRLFGPEEEITTYIQPTMNGIFNADVTYRSAKMQAAMAQMKNPEIDMSESSTLRSVRDVFWVGIVATCGLLISWEYNIVWPYDQNCILDLSYTGPPTLTFESFTDG